MEKRLPITITARLNSMRNQSEEATELTYTDNISSYGARVISTHPWQTGELAQISSIEDQITTRGKVIYCQTLADGRYGIGLNFEGPTVSWEAFRKSSRNPARQLLPQLRAL